MKPTRAILRSAIAATALTLVAFAVPSSASASVTTAPIVSANFAQSEGTVAVQQVKYKKKFLRRNHNRRSGHYGQQRRGVAGVGHGRGLTGGSRYDRSRQHNRSHGHGWSGNDHYDQHGHGHRSTRSPNKRGFPFRFFFGK